MLKLHQLFFRIFLSLFLMIILVSATTIYFWVKNIFLEQVEKNLSRNVDSLAIALTTLDNIDNIVDNLKEKTSLRITIINKDGDVIAESDEDKERLENHANRKEIIHAKYDGMGTDIRLSESINKELVYLAKKVEIDGEIVYIRMADNFSLLTDEFVKLSLQVTMIFSIFLIFAFLITYIISTKIKVETDNVLNFLTKLTKKESMEDISSNFTTEFYQITRLLKKVRIRLDKRDRQKAKHTAKLKMANQQKDEIISAISHEFKNPIAIISGYVETIQSDKDLPDSIRDKFLTKIHSNANKMSQIIDRLRLTLNLEKNNTNGLMSKCNIKNICLDIVSDLEQKYVNREIKVVGADLELLVDETMFTIALTNLIENALKYSEAEVEVVVNRNSIHVVDKGIGINMQDLKKITNKFYRVSNNGWNNSLGLGLYIVYKIVELHNFKLVIDSELNVGSTFKIVF